MSLAELRGQLREMRKSACSVPISKMKKHEVILELEGHKKKPAKLEVESESESEAEVVPMIKEKKAPAPKKERIAPPSKKQEVVKAPAPKKEKVVKEKEEPMKVEKVSIKSAPRKKKAE